MSAINALGSSAWSRTVERHCRAWRDVCSLLESAKSQTSQHAFERVSDALASSGMQSVAAHLAQVFSSRGDRSVTCMFEQSHRSASEDWTADAAENISSRSRERDNVSLACRVMDCLASVSRFCISLW